MCCLLAAAHSVPTSENLSPVSAAVLAAPAPNALKDLGMKAISFVASQVLPLLKEKPTDIIKKKLDEIAKQITALESRLDVIDQQLGQISLQQFLIPANHYRSIVTTLHQKMVFFISTAPHVTKEQWEANLKELKDAIDRDAFKACQQLRDLMVGNSATQSLFAAMQNHLVETENTVVQEYVKLRQLGLLYWGAFQQAADMFEFLSEGKTNLYYVEQANRMATFIEDTDRDLSQKYMGNSLSTLVRDMFAAAPREVEIDFSNMYSTDSKYRPQQVQWVPVSRAMRRDDLYLTWSCRPDSCFKYQFTNNLREVSFYMNADGSMYLRSNGCGENIRFGWNAGLSCMAGASVSDEDNVPFHMYRVKGETMVIRFNNEMGRYYQRQDEWLYMCTKHRKVGIHDEWIQDNKDFPSVPVVKREQLCIWNVDFV
jgi:hypothetical protein